jgi:putative Ca2+/H+ antiporter (TMEM165/GDT1 family)
LVGSAAFVVPRVFTYYASALLFAIFGVKMLREGYKMSTEEAEEEFEEAQAEIKRREEELEMRAVGGTQKLNDLESGVGSTARRPNAAAAKNFVQRLTSGIHRFAHACFSRIFIEAFTLNFLAEWGDRSQITAIVLATSEVQFLID